MNPCDVVGSVVIESALDFGADFFRGAEEVGVEFEEDVVGRDSAGADFCGDAVGNGEFGKAADVADVADADDDGR